MSNKMNALSNDIIYTNSKMLNKNQRNELVRNLLKNITDEELMQLVKTRQQIRTPMPAPRRTTNGSTLNNSLDKTTPRRRPIPTPRRSVKELVKQYEENIIQPPIQFRDKPIPAPRTKTRYFTKKPVAAKRTFISQTEKALKGYTKSYEIEVGDEMDPLKQLNITKTGVEYELKKQLEQLKGYKFVLTLKVFFLMK